MVFQPFSVLGGQNVNHQLGGGFKYFFYFYPYLGKIPILTNIVQSGWNHQLVKLCKTFINSKDRLIFVKGLFFVDDHLFQLKLFFWMVILNLLQP